MSPTSNVKMYAFWKIIHNKKVKMSFAPSNAVGKVLEQCFVSFFLACQVRFEVPLLSTKHLHNANTFFRHAKVLRQYDRRKSSQVGLKNALLW